jgi:hypothetical protein
MKPCFQPGQSKSQDGEREPLQRLFLFNNVMHPLFVDDQLRIKDERMPPVPRAQDLRGTLQLVTRESAMTPEHANQCLAFRKPSPATCFSDRHVRSNGECWDLRSRLGADDFEFVRCLRKGTAPSPGTPRCKTSHASEIAPHSRLRRALRGSGSWRLGRDAGDGFYGHCPIIWWLAIALAFV